MSLNQTYHDVRVQDTCKDAVHCGQGSQYLVRNGARKVNWVGMVRAIVQEAFDRWAASDRKGLQCLANPRVSGDGASKQISCLLYEPSKLTVRGAHVAAPIRTQMVPDSSACMGAIASLLKWCRFNNSYWLINTRSQAHSASPASFGSQHFKEVNLIRTIGLSNRPNPALSVLHSDHFRARTTLSRRDCGDHGNSHLHVHVGLVPTLPDESSK